MPQASYQTRREQLRTYFDHTAVEAWKRLTSDAPVSGIRATVRQGRDQMRAMLGDVPQLQVAPMKDRDIFDLLGFD